MCKPLDDDFKNRVLLESHMKARRDLRKQMEVSRHQYWDWKNQEEDLTFAIERLKHAIPSEKMKIIKRVIKSDPKKAEKMAKELEQDLSKQRRLQDQEIKQLIEIGD